MYCLECLYENWNKDTKRKGGTTDNRFQLSQQILYMKEEDLPLVKDIVDFSISLVIKCNSRKFSEQWVNDMHKEMDDSNRAPGVGGVSALVFIQLAATCGLINPVYALWGKVTSCGTNGAYCYLNKHMQYRDSDKEIDLETANCYFDHLFKMLKQTHRSIEKCILNLDVVRLVEAQRSI